MGSEKALYVKCTLYIRPPAPPPKKTIKTLNPITVTSTTNLGGWHVDLSESSGDEENGAGGPASGPKKARIVERVIDCKVSLRDHDYCYASFRAAQPAEDLSEMGKILSDVAIGSTEQVSTPCTHSSFMYLY